MTRTFMPIAALAAALSLTGGAAAVETSLQLVLELPASAERTVTSYECEGLDAPLAVEYIDAAPLFLAVLPVAEERLLFVNVIAGSGVRYASGQYEWWTKGSEATLTNLTGGEGAPELSCLAIVDTP